MLSVTVRTLRTGRVEVERGSRSVLGVPGVPGQPPGIADKHRDHHLTGSLIFWYVSEEARTVRTAGTSGTRLVETRRSWGHVAADTNTLFRGMYPVGLETSFKKGRPHPPRSENMKPLMALPSLMVPLVRRCSPASRAVEGNSLTADVD